MKGNWPHMHLWQIQPLRDTLVLSSFVGLLYLGYVLSVVTVPILLALFLAYLFEPLVRRITAKHNITRARVAASIIVLSIILIGVPTAIGVTYSVMQGVRYTKQVVRSINAVSASVRSPDDEGLRREVRSRSSAWGWVRDYIVEERGKARTLEDRREQRLRDLSSLVAPAGSATVSPSDTPEEKVTPQTSQGPGGVTPSQEGDGDVSPPRAQAPMYIYITLPDELHGPPALDENATLATLPPESEDEPSELFRVLELLRDNLERHATDIGRNLFQAGGGAVAAIFDVLAYVGTLIFTVALTGFFFYFFCTGYGRVLKFWEGLLPHHKKSELIALLEQMDGVISGFIRGRLTICAVMVGVYTVGYAIVGVPAAWIVGPIVGLLTLVPYAAGAASPIAIILMLLEPGDGLTGSWWWAIAGPLLVLAVTQFLDDYILTPRIQGKTTNMDMPTILFASIAGGVLAGFYGLLLAIPAAACIRILLTELVMPRVKAWAMGRADDILPISKE